MLDAPKIRRNSSGGERCWGASRPNAWNAASHSSGAKRTVSDSPIGIARLSYRR